MRFYLFLFLLISSFTIVAQTPQKLPQSIADYERLIKYYRYYIPDSAVFLAKKAMEFAESQNDLVGKAKILLQQGMIDDNEGEFSASKEKYLEALSIFSDNENDIGKALAINRLGVVELRNGNYDRATEQFLEALKISENIEDTAGMAEAQYNISWAHLDQKNYLEALHYLLLAYELNNKVPFSSLNLNIYNHLGVTYTRLEEFEKAKQNLEKGIPLSNAPEYQGLYITMTNNLAAVYALQGNIDKAVSIQLKILQQSRALHNYLRELQVLSGLFKTLRGTDPEAAVDYMMEAITLAREKQAYKQEMRYLEMITDFYKEKGDYEAAFLMKEREHALADSFYYQTMSQNIEALKAEYELGKSKVKLEELKVINTQRELELQKAQLFRNLVICGIVVLAIILILGFNQFRIKQKANHEINRKNLDLQLLLTEKEWLLKEVHHRVKNNLQVVMSLLNTQAIYLDNDAALNAIRESQHRMQAMALIHQKLYQSDNIAAIDMQSYIRELVEYLKESYDLDYCIQFKLQIDPIETDVAQAVPLGLILNEAITNSIKYAFSDRLHGTISIMMKNHHENQISLIIKDDGVGLPKELNVYQNNSLGLNLIKGLSSQLDGDFAMVSDHGVTITIDFKDQKMFSTNTTHPFSKDAKSVIW